ncbi:hypothetical protein BU14_0084s0008 [Porphyra umbilicalis]|uniref:Uncharacterized protein n=1 Tax=Porphyra umbilicalis TaxID=2786 RepID=A0A1X6PEV4_PORUM|nr:hypothetical protein BU14_0084s0008 [Porphyra umbilicalis]|eukprot:OSX79193.1 hypothetical protein BU14_0084s0008 [Porphyra umbilicalis]
MSARASCHKVVARRFELGDDECLSQLRRSRCRSAPKNGVMLAVCNGGHFAEGGLTPFRDEPRCRGRRS